MRLEHWFYTILLRLRSLFRRSQMDQELEDELQIHLEQQIAQEEARGKTSEAARYAALRAVGGLEQRKEECRDSRRVRWLHDLMQDCSLCRPHPGQKHRIHHSSYARACSRHRLEHSGF
jgi:macrolide transport system ATP-binding/permease protein